MKCGQNTLRRPRQDIKLARADLLCYDVYVSRRGLDWRGLLLTLVQPHVPAVLAPHVLVHVPAPALLEVPVQLADILLGVRDAAQAQDRHDAVHAALLDAPVPLAAVVEFFDPHRHDPVHVLEPGPRDRLPQARVLVPVWFYAVHARDAFATAATSLGAPSPHVRPRLRTRDRAEPFRHERGEHVDPEPGPGADLEHDTSDGRARRHLILEEDAAGGGAALEQGHDALGGVQADIGPRDAAPELAEPGVPQRAWRQQHREPALAQEVQDGPGQARGRDAEEQPRAEEARDGVGGAREEGHGFSL